MDCKPTICITNIPKSMGVSEMLRAQQTGAYQVQATNFSNKAYEEGPVVNLNSPVLQGAGGIIICQRDNVKTALNEFYKNGIIVSDVWYVMRSLKTKPSLGNQNWHHVDALSPSDSLFHWYLNHKSQGTWSEAKFLYEYLPNFCKEMRELTAQKELHDLCEKVAQGQTIMLVCACPDESMCHRSILAAGLYCRKIPVINEHKQDVGYYYYEKYFKFYLLVAGSRTFTDAVTMENALNHLLAKKVQTHRIVIVEGGAKGADTLAREYAERHGFEVQEFPAHWDVYGQSAGYRRNAEMHAFLTKYPNRACLCFWDGSSKGTADNFERCKQSHTSLRIYNFAQNRFLTPQEIDQL